VFEEQQEHIIYGVRLVGGIGAGGYNYNTSRERGMEEWINTGRIGKMEK
jgi:hypothetical protein